MILTLSDYNGAEAPLRKTCRQEWAELEVVLKKLPLCLKASDQAGKQGSPIFDPVATNAFIRNKLKADHGWATNIPIPQEYEFLGTDIDAGKNGVMVEVQFSNYPFLLNNMLRGELFFQGKFKIGSRATGVVVIVAKAQMLPASNSTLYYEQAKKQLDALAKNRVFRVPLRLVGLTCPVKEGVPALWTDSGGRYSRDLSKQTKVVCDIRQSSRTRCRITVHR